MTAQTARWVPAYIGVGSNLNSPVSQVQQAIIELAAIEQSRVASVSALYESAPMGPPDQPMYINAVVSMLTRLSPHRLLDALQNIEQMQGRTRDGVHWGPRTLDLDLLVFSNLQIHDDRLIVPHAGIAERIFVLLPLCELAPHLEVPGRGPVDVLLRSLPESVGQIEKIENPLP